MMKIERVVSDLLASNMYLIEASGHGIIVDPCRDLSACNSALCYDWIFLTHEHYDHISGVDAWRERTGAKVICPSICGENLKDDKRNLSRYFQSFCELQTWVPYESGRTFEPYTTHADVVFDERMELNWQGHRIVLFAAPGHSEGGSCMLVDGTCLFAGDCLLPGNEPALRFSGGSRKQRKEKTLPLLRELPRETTVYPGHFDVCELTAFSLNG